MSTQNHHVLDSQSGTGVGSLHDASVGCDADLYLPMTVPVRGEVGIVPPTLAGTQVGDPTGEGSIDGRSVHSNSWLSANPARAGMGTIDAQCASVDSGMCNDAGPRRDSLLEYVPHGHASGRLPLPRVAVATTGST